MKRITALTLALILAVCLAGCGGPTEYIPCEDVEVVGAYAVNGEGTVITRNVTGKDLSEIQIACLYFDANGTAIYDELDRFDCTFSYDENPTLWTIDIPVGTAYIEAVISGTTGEESWDNDTVSVWARQTKESFTVESHEAKIAALAGLEAVAAENCEYAQVLSTEIAEGSFSIELRNLSDKDIANMELFVTWYDAAGEPVAVDLVDYCPNGEWVSIQDLYMNETATYSYTLESQITAGCTAKVLIDTIEFTDGETWGNPYFYEWVIAGIG